MCTPEVTSYRALAINTDHSTTENIYYSLTLGGAHWHLRADFKKTPIDCVSKMQCESGFGCLQSLLTTLQKHFLVDSQSQWMFLYVMPGIAIQCSIWLNIPSTINHIMYTAHDVMDFQSFTVSFIWLRHTSDEKITAVLAQINMLNSCWRLDRTTQYVHNKGLALLNIVKCILLNIDISAWPAQVKSKCGKHWNILLFLVYASKDSQWIYWLNLLNIILDLPSSETTRNTIKKTQY